MAEEKEKPAPAPAPAKRVDGAQRIAIAAALLVIVLLGAAYWRYYERQRAYYTARDLRILRTMTALLDERVTVNSENVKNWVLKHDPSVLTVTENCGRKVVGKDEADLPEKLKAMPGGEWIERSLVDTGREKFLRLAYYTVGPKDKVLRGCSDVPLADLLRPAFDIDLSEAFDDIMVADAYGHVLDHIHPPPSRSTLLFESAPSTRDAGGSPVKVNDLNALRESKGFLADPKPLALPPLLQATRRTNVVLADAGYILFTQPYLPGTVGQNQRWIICGLVSASHFRKDTARIPAPVALLGMALAILAICAWPFLRIALTNELEPLTISDAVLLAMCTIIIAAVLTLAFLETYAYTRLTNIARDHLVGYGNTLAADFENDVARAAAALDSIRYKTIDFKKNWNPVQTSLAAPDPRGTNVDPLKNYPYFTSFAWLDEKGVELFKYARTRGSSREDLGKRQFVIDALNNNNLWLTNEELKPGGGTQRIPFAMEWMRLPATGEVTAVIAERTELKDRPVIVLTTDLVDVTHSVPPPDVGFAVIDEQGNVLDHSQHERIGFENFFAETDDDARLRAAVLGRQDQVVETSYRGDNTEMYVVPLESPAWTLVVFRPKRFTRVLNEQTVLLTLVPLLAGAVPYLLLYCIVLVAAPRYRAPMLWPDPARRGDYVRLARLYGLLGAAYALSIYLFDWRSLLPIVYLFPAVTIVSTYILLHRDDRRPRVGVALAIWILLGASLAVFIVRAAPDTGVFVAVLVDKRIPKAVLLLLLVAAAVVSLWSFMPAEEGGAKREKFRMSYGSAYRLCGALLLVVAAALPVVGNFKIALHLSLELYAKYAQLRMATKLEGRLNALASTNGLGTTNVKTQSDAVDYGILHIFQSHWCLWPSLRDCEECGCKSAKAWATIPPLLPDLLPALSESFMTTHLLQSARSYDTLWSWCATDDGLLRLDRKIRLQPANAALLYGRPADDQHAQDQQHLVLTSNVPLLREIGAYTDPHPVWHLLAKFVALVVASAIAFLIFWIAVDFIARNLFLIDVAGPLWLSHVPLSPSLGDHIFLVRRTRKADALTGPKRFFNVSFAEMAKNKTWDKTLAKIDRSRAGRNVRIVDFEYGIDDGGVNWQKLEWLERLLALPDRTVIIVSSVSAGYVLTADTTPPAPPPPPADATVVVAAPVVAATPAVNPVERWKRVLESFVWVTEEQLGIPPKPAANVPPKPADNRPWLAAVGAWLSNRLTFRFAKPDWIRDEAKYDRYLARVGKEITGLQPEIPAGQEHELFLDEIGERARSYYAGLWASCSIDERVLLYQLARNGFINGKDRRLVRRLMARRFIRRVPQLEIFSETFRRFVLAAGRDDNLKSVAATLRPSRWKDLRAAFAVLVIAFVVLLFGTQQNLLSSANTLITGATGAIPLIIKLLGLLGDRRSGAGAQ